MNMEQNNPLVVCSGLTKTYGSFTALDHLDLTLERGRFIGLLSISVRSSSAVRMQGTGS